ncbi:hypothetical protein [Tropicimonas sp.]|uniref:COG4223 family protein n=1 Tax=Tropicimonas sp. TaxID=2067044 RepID=UPI003A8A7DFA
MTDKKTPDTASNGTERTEEDLGVEAQPQPDADREPDQTAREGDSDIIEDAEIVDGTEIVSEHPDALVEPAEPAGTPPAASGTPDAGPLVLEDAIPADETEADEPGGLPVDQPADEPDDNTVDEDDVTALETLDGVAGHPAAAETTLAAAAIPLTAPADSATAEPEPVDAKVDPIPDHRSGPEPKPEPARAAATALTPEKETVIERRGGVLPGFVGGAVAALGLAFAAPYVIPADKLPFNTVELQKTIAGQGDTIGTLQAEIADLRGKLAEAATTADLAALRSEADATRDTISTQISSVSGSLDELRAQAATADNLAQTTAGLAQATASISAMGAEQATIRTQIAELEKRPIAEATDPAAVSALRAYEAEMAALRNDVAAQIGRSEELAASTAAAANEAVERAVAASQAAMADAEAAKQAAMADAEAAKQAAAAEAAAAARAQALVDIQAALETGAPFDGALAALGQTGVPAALSAVAGSGVATLADLQKSFAPAAREALAGARREAAPDDDMGGRVGSFMQRQLGLRSLAPREGNDPDAVLSRAEANVAGADLAGAVSELSNLPQAGQQAMAEWIALADARARALAAADELAASLATN